MGSEVEGKLLVSFLSFPWGGDWATRAHATAAAIEQLLVCRFENLFKKKRETKMTKLGKIQQEETFCCFVIFQERSA